MSLRVLAGLLLGVVVLGATSLVLAPARNDRISALGEVDLTDFISKSPHKVKTSTTSKSPQNVKKSTVSKSPQNVKKSTNVEQVPDKKAEAETEAAKCPHYMAAGCLLDKAQGACQMNSNGVRCYREARRGNRTSCSTAKGPGGELETNDLWEDVQLCCTRPQNNSLCSANIQPVTTKAFELNKVFTRCAQGDLQACAAAMELYTPVMKASLSVANTLREACHLPKVDGTCALEFGDLEGKQLITELEKWKKLQPQDDGDNEEDEHRNDDDEHDDTANDE